MIYNIDPCVTATHLKAETVHFEEHFEGEEDDEEQVGDLLEVVEPRRLAVVLGRLKNRRINVFENRQINVFENRSISVFENRRNNALKN
jgi:hypothetical protein